jgi:hypothetical protein
VLVPFQRSLIFVAKALAMLSGVSYGGSLAQIKFSGTNTLAY